MLICISPDPKAPLPVPVMNSQQIKPPSYISYLISVYSIIYILLAWEVYTAKVEAFMVQLLPSLEIKSLKIRGAVQGCFLQGGMKCKHTVIHRPHNGAHVWSQRRAVKHASACSTVQDRTKFTNGGLTLTTFCQVRADISLLWRKSEKVLKKGSDSEQLIRPHFWVVSLEEWW